MNMKATRQLRDEHDGVTVMLNIMEKVCRHDQESGSLNMDHFESILEFLKVFVDKCHHAKEEELLFPALEALGVLKEGGPIGEMLSEHTQGREFIKAMVAASFEYKNGEKSARGGMIRHAQDYVSLLSGHIEKENNVLFVMAEKLLSEGQQEELFQGFEKIEADRIGLGKHEAFHELIHTLKEIYLD